MPESMDMTKLVPPGVLRDKKPSVILVRRKRAAKTPRSAGLDCLNPVTALFGPDFLLCPDGHSAG